MIRNLKRGKFIYVVAIAVVLECFVGNTSVEKVFANSAQKWFHGVDGIGTIMNDKECPVVVEHETLRFDIRSFPEMSGMQDNYDATVTAEYVLYNPSEYTITINLLFPFGNKPEYSTKVYDKENDTYVDRDNTQQHAITVNDKVVDKEVRHTYSPGYFRFETEKDMNLLKNDFVESRFYSPELTVTEYTYRVSEGELDSSDRMAFDVDADMKKSTVICIGEPVYVREQQNGDKRICFYGSKAGEKITVYAIGEPFETLPQWKFYDNNGVANNDEIFGCMTLEETRQYSFLEFALQGTEKTPEVSAVDRYNAVVTQFENTVEDGILELTSMENGVPVYYMQWYEYEISIAPGERIVNKVTAPLYPAINMFYDSDVFEYTYLLSPAKTWKKFGTIDIIINTPYFLIESEMQEFEKIEDGYTLSLSGLPDSELKFTLSEVEHPKKEDWFFKLIYLLFNRESKESQTRNKFIFLICVIIVVIVLISLFGKKNNNGKD